VTEKNSKVPLRQKGWQDALEAAYPFKINRITIDHGDIVSIQDAVNPPLHLAGLNFTADNIRNIHAPDNAYPSRFHASLVIFDTGHATVDGHANFLEGPFPGARAVPNCQRAAQRVRSGDSADQYRSARRAPCQRRSARILAQGNQGRSQ
jgi:hypothetical protein